jgi:hypothetical protein
MINNILLAAAVSIPVTPLCAPVLAENINSPKTTTTTSIMSGFASNSNPPSLNMGVRETPNNIACRKTARDALFQLSARDMSSSDSNEQWATVDNMRVLVWCRGNHAVIGVSGYNYNSVTEVRDFIGNKF